MDQWDTIVEGASSGLNRPGYDVAEVLLIVGNMHPPRPTRRQCQLILSTTARIARSVSVTRARYEEHIVQNAK